MTNITDDNVLLQEVNNYINASHIKPLVEDGMNQNVQGGNHGQLIHAVISWNPHNLVAGPLPTSTPAAVTTPPVTSPTGPPYYRSVNDDPGSNFDTNVNRKQTPAYQNQIANVGTLSDFRQVPDNQPVDWVHDPTDQGRLKVAP